MKQWELSRAEYGPLWEFIIDSSITDIDYDNGQLWLEYSDGRKIKKDLPELTDEVVENFTQYVANHISQSFNPQNNTLSAETDNLRITVAHETLVTSGRCFFIRKSNPYLRFSAIGALKDNYCPEALMHFLVNAVECRMSMAFVGEPGAGKTEGAKFFSSFIKAEDKVITIEDALEWHYKHINPGKRVDEIRVNENADYIKSIKLALRMNPSWLMLSEARSREVEYLIEGWSTGVSGMTTLHTDDVQYIPDRIVNMAGGATDPVRMINNVYSYLDIGILVEKELNEDGETSTRRITQVGLFYRENGENKCAIIYEDGKFKEENIPTVFKNRMKKKHIKNPLFSDALQKRINNEKNGIFYGMDSSVQENANEKLVKFDLDTMENENGLSVDEEIAENIVEVMEG